MSRRALTVHGRVATLTDSQRRALSQDGFVKKAGSTVNGYTRYITVEHGATGTGLKKRGLVECKRHRGRFTSGLTNDWYLTESGEEVRDALRTVFADPRIEPGVVGPRRVGGRYLCGYGRQEYTVTAIKYEDSWRGTCISVLWEDGTTSTHGTAWDERHDKVLEEAGEA